jgi:hypothetical protein
MGTIWLVLGIIVFAVACLFVLFWRLMTKLSHVNYVLTENPQSLLETDHQAKAKQPEDEVERIRLAMRKVNSFFDAAGVSVLHCYGVLVSNDGEECGFICLDGDKVRLTLDNESAAILMNGVAKMVGGQAAVGTTLSTVGIELVALTRAD